MVLGCGAKVLKYCLFAFNLVFFIAGIVCLGIGIYLIVDEHAIDQLIKAAQAQSSDLQGKQSAVYALGVIMSVGGAIILVIAFLGCCGAVKEWRPLLVLYAICLMIILAIEIAAAIYAAVNRNTMESTIKSGMNETLKLYDGTSKDPSGVRAVWDKLMKADMCCGVNNTTSNEFVISDWFVKTFKPRYDAFRLTDLTNFGGSRAEDYYPSVCCKDVNVETDALLIASKLGIGLNTVNDTVCHKNNRVDQGCYQKLKEGVESKLAIVIGVGAGVGLIQLIGIVFSLCLCRAISDEYVG